MEGKGSVYGCERTSALSRHDRQKEEKQEQPATTNRRGAHVVEIRIRGCIVLILHVGYPTAAWRGGQYIELAVDHERGL